MQGSSSSAGSSAAGDPHLVCGCTVLCTPTACTDHHSLCALSCLGSHWDLSLDESCAPDSPMWPPALGSPAPQTHNVWQSLSSAQTDTATPLLSEKGLLRMWSRSGSSQDLGTRLVQCLTRAQLSLPSRERSRCPSRRRRRSPSASLLRSHLLSRGAAGAEEKHDDVCPRAGRGLPWSLARRKQQLNQGGSGARGRGAEQGTQVMGPPELTAGSRGRESCPQWCRSRQGGHAL